MKLQQLRCVLEVARQGLSVSAAAARLYTSQPAVSKQLRALEEELGVALFVRRGKQFVALTPAGEEIVALAEEVLRRAESIRRVAQDHASPARGELTIVAPHAIACGRLPAALAAFRDRYPQVRVRVLAAGVKALPATARDAQADAVLTPLPPQRHEGFLLLPCGGWSFAVLAPHDHPLAGAGRVGLETLAGVALIAQAELLEPGEALADALAQRDLRLDVRISAPDRAVLTALVRAGLGAGLTVAETPGDEPPPGLSRIALADLPGGVLYAGLRRDVRPRAYVHDFITSYAPHLTRELIAEALAARDAAAIAALVATSAPAAMI